MIWMKPSWISKRRGRRACECRSRQLSCSSVHGATEETGREIRKREPGLLRNQQSPICTSPPPKRLRFVMLLLVASAQREKIKKKATRSYASQSRWLGCRGKMNAGGSPCLVCAATRTLKKAGERGRKRPSWGGKANAFQETGDSRCGLAEYNAIGEQVRSTSYLGPGKPKLRRFGAEGIL